MDDDNKQLTETGHQMVNQVSEAFHFPWPRKPAGKPTPRPHGKAPSRLGKPSRGGKGKTKNLHNPFAAPPIP